MKRCVPLIGVGLLAAISPMAAAGPDWVERGDAGGTLGSAQTVQGVGELRRITGTLSSSLAEPDLEDMYLVRIDQPTTLRFDLTAATFDTKAYIFSYSDLGKGLFAAFGILANDDSPLDRRPGSLIDGPANDGSGAAITEPGLYLIAICGAGRSPVSGSGSIYNIVNPTEISGPDGPGGTDFHKGWVGVGATGSYSMVLEGFGFAEVPAPGTLVAVLGGMTLFTRRRRDGRA